MGQGVGFMTEMKLLGDRCPRVLDYFERLQKRPAFKKALEV